MKEIEILAPSPEEARELASTQTKVDKEFLEVIEEYEPDEIDLKEYAEKHGIEGLPGKDEISLYVISIAFSHYVKKAQDWTQGLIQRFVPGAEAEAVRFRHLVIIRLKVPESSILIGKQGATLDALQHVVVRALLTLDENFPDIMLDVERYREKKLIRLEKEAKRAAEKAQRNGRKIPLTPMSPAERKFIHNTLKDIEGIRTESRGKDRTRHIVVESTNPRPQHAGSGSGGGGGARQRPQHVKMTHGGQEHGNVADGIPGRPAGRKGPQGPISEEQRQKLYGRMTEQFRETELETKKELLPKYVPQEPVEHGENMKFEDELE